MRIATFGGSVLWGQGLREASTIGARVSQALALRGGLRAEIVSFARSGTRIWEDGEADLGSLSAKAKALSDLPGLPPDWVRHRAAPSPASSTALRAGLGELPNARSFTLCQIDAAVAELGGKAVDLVLLEAGLDDVGIPHVVLPFTSVVGLAARTASLAPRLRVLLEHAHACFPSARIVVTGYYPIVTEHSDVERLVRFAANALRLGPEELRRRDDLSPHAAELDLAEALLDRDRALREPGAGATAGDLGSRLLAPMKQRLIELSRAFADGARSVLRREVDAFNSRRPANAALAVPAIPAEHAILTRDPWIFGLTSDLDPEDDVVDERRALVAARTSDPLQWFFWERASLGCPTSRGVDAFVEAILRVV